MFWEAMFKVVIETEHTVEISLVDLARELRSSYPELRGPRSWSCAFRWWRILETEPWKRVIFNEIVSYPALHSLLVEEPLRVDGLQLEGPEHLPQGQDGLPDEMDIDQEWL